MAEQTATRTAHTPGPWRYEPASSRLIVWTADGPGRGAVADLTSQTHVLPAGQHSWEARKAEVEANARLIAAAPELLAALTDLVERFTPEYMTDIAAIDSAKAAIAKATGASS